jgi:putative transcriptional regulator
LKKRSWLMEIRKRKNLTQKDVAEEAGISPSYYSGLECGWRIGPLKTAAKVAKVLDFPVEWFESPPEEVKS